MRPSERLYCITVMYFRPSIIITIAVTAVFGIAFGWVVVAISRSQRVEENVRIAQLARARLPRLELDQETGIRGFAMTGDQEFLRTYETAARTFELNILLAREAFTRIGAREALDALSDADRAHRQWIAEVAKPFLAGPPRSSVRGLLMAGKRLDDRFRGDDAMMADALARVAADSDRNARNLVALIVAAGLSLGVGLLLLALWIDDRQRRLERELLEKHLLYERERQIANTLQDAVIARELPSVPGLTIHAHYRPADEPERIGGDWYDAFALPDGRIFVVVGDMSGHGIAAALNMSRFRHAIIEAALNETEPGAILTAANRRILRSHSEQLLGTAVCAFLDPTCTEMSFATAGHPPPLVASQNLDVRILECHGVPMGLQEYVYSTRSFEVAPGSVVVFYTDGLTEISGDIVEGEARMLQAAAHTVAESAEDPALGILQRILREAKPRDDIAIVSIAVKSKRTDREHAVRGVLDNFSVSSVR
jgi:hypothetical protein